SSGPGPESAALTARFRALGAFEPRQVRKEAALRSSSQVPRSGPARASGSGSSRGSRFEAGCATGHSVSVADARAKPAHPLALRAGTAKARRIVLAGIEAKTPA